MKFGVKILPRSEVLDPQGRAVQGLMENQGFSLKQCHMGKYIVLEVEAENLEQGKGMVSQMVDKLLHNPLIESYEVEPLG